MVMMNKREMSYHEDTELRLGLPGSKEVVDKQSFPKTSERKRSFSNMSEELAASCMSTSPNDHDLSQPIKVQAIGWPPVKSYRKNCLQATKRQDIEATSIYVKVSMDGAPYLRKIDLRLYKGYKELLKALEDMFILKDDKPSKISDTKNNGSEYKPTYEDKDGDWMLVGDVPWEMFLSSCKRLRIMKLGSEPKDLACLS